MVEDVLVTEAGSDPGCGYESKATQDLVELMNTADATVPSAVGIASSEIAVAVDGIAERMRAGGNLLENVVALTHARQKDSSLPKDDQGRLSA